MCQMIILAGLLVSSRVSSGIPRRGRRSLSGGILLSSSMAPSVGGGVSMVGGGSGT